MSETTINEQIISAKWHELKFAEKLTGFDGPISLDESMQCLKDSFKSSIWRLNVRVQGQSIPIILKIFKSMRSKRAESLTELNIYRKTRGILHDFMPHIYLTYSRVTGDDSWVFMQHTQQIEGQVVFTPRHLDNIIPSLAKLHAHTHHNRFLQQKETFTPWLPRYDSREMARKRRKINEQTKFYLDAAMERRDLHRILAPSYSLLRKLLHKGPNYFPELITAGQSIVHSDLQARNIGCNNINEPKWHITFMDWEGAQWAPCWFDMISLVGIFLGYRTDWIQEEKSIIHHCSHLYADEMNRQGVLFKTDPVKLYKMAYLQLILEEYLFLQLSWEVDGRKKGKLLPSFLQKIDLWGKQLKLY